MVAATGWDALMLSVDVTDNGWHVRAGAGFVLGATLVLYRLLSRDEDKATGRPPQGG